LKIIFRYKLLLFFVAYLTTSSLLNLSGLDQLFGNTKEDSDSTAFCFYDAADQEPDFYMEDSDTEDTLKKVFFKLPWIRSGYFSLTVQVVFFEHNKEKIPIGLILIMHNLPPPPSA